MSSAAKKKRNKKNNGNQQPVRVLIRCSWSGARHPVPSPLPTTGRPVTPSTSLSDVIGSIRDALPGTIFDDDGGGGGGRGATVVYLRKSAGRESWDTTTLRDLGVGEEDGDGGGGSGSAGVLLTLNLPGGGGGGNASASAATATAAKSPPTAAEPAATSMAASAPVAAAVAPSDPQPMDVDATSAPSSSSSPSLSTTCKSPSDAIDLLLSSNFDADSRETVVTLLKVLDNVLSKPGDSRVRTIRLGNPAIYKKVTSRKGALDFLVTVGFAAKPKEVPLLSGSVGGVGGGIGGAATEKKDEVEFIELTEENEDLAQILDARKLLASKAVHVLGMKASDLPKLSPSAAASSAAASQSDRKRTASGGEKGGGKFDPYRAHSYNTQSAAAASASSSRGGGPDPNSVTPGSADAKSKTEKELDLLKAKRNRLEKKMQKLEDRELVATRPGPRGATVTLPSSEPDTSFAASGGGGGGKGDGALLAARMKRMEEERKRREEGGLTTKAMRDLEKMKKERVYSHATVRVSFPDGCALTAKFLPRERVRDVREAVVGALNSGLLGDKQLKFDLYVAPPRRLMDDAKRLDEEGLVPAAKVHVSWKVGGGPPAGWEVGAYLRPELFANVDAASAEAFPDAEKLVREDGDIRRKGTASAAAGNGGNGEGNGGGGSREEELMRRMMGGSKGLLGKLGGGGNKKGGGGKDGKSKPKWFKG